MTEVAIEISNETSDVTIDVTGYTAAGGSGTLQPNVEYESPGGEQSFEVDDLDGATVIAAFRAGTIQKIVTGTPTKTREIKIDGTTVTLLTGDLTTVDELFTFIITR